MSDWPSRCYLLGARGSGKSTVGRLLAARVGWHFLDADECVEAIAGCSVADIFAAEGEAGFRGRESAALRDLSQQPRHVIATGGGCVLSEANRDLLRSTGYCVWLTGSAQALWERIQSDPATTARRPALTNLSGEDEVVRLLAARTPLYAAVAHRTVSTDGVSPEAVVSAILSGWTPCS